MPIEITKPKVAISADFLKSYSLLSPPLQRKVREFLEKFQSNPAAPGINYEKIANARDPNLRSVRIDKAYRGIVLKPEKGNAFLLLWVDNHDQAYQWAQNRLFGIHPETGSLQVVDVDDDLAPPPVSSTPTWEYKGLFHNYKDKDFFKLGIPEMLFNLVRNIKTEEQLEENEKNFPQEAYEALYMLAAGFTLSEVINEQERKVGAMAVDTTDFAAALDAPDSQRRFHVVADADELADILNAPLDQWRIFLHPSQKNIVQWSVNGPVRILGGAGTGKTVVAMHRARWLADNMAVAEQDRVLFTTFTRNLAEDILHNLRKLCSAGQLSKIDVINIDSWVANFLASHGQKFSLFFNGPVSQQWKSALAQAPSPLNDDKFLREEWSQIIQANGIRSLDEYLRTSRVGRKRRLTRLEKKAIWPVFEGYRASLEAAGLKEPADAMHDARSLLMRFGDVLPYKAILVDEAQDMGPETFRLIRQMIPPSRPSQKNNIFITGDAHQRIYGQKVVLSQCGIDIRGRSRKLRINYRTTEETRKWAVRLLEGRDFDDMDGSLDNQKGYCSLLHGNSPQVVGSASFSEEVKLIKCYLQDLEKSGIHLENICLVARTNDLIDQYESALRSTGFSIFRIQRSVADERETPGLRIATIHRVKGLEFDYMVVAGVNEGVVPLPSNWAADGDSNPLVDNETRERALLYVAVTRAKKGVMISSHGTKSSFL